MLMMHRAHKLAARARAAYAGSDSAAAEEAEDMPDGTASLLSLLSADVTNPDPGPSPAASVLELPVDLAGACAPPCAPVLLDGAR